MIGLFFLGGLSGVVSKLLVFFFFERGVSSFFELFFLFCQMVVLLLITCFFQAHVVALVFKWLLGNVFQISSVLFESLLRVHQWSTSLMLCDAFSWVIEKNSRKKTQENHYFPRNLG